MKKFLLITISFIVTCGNTNNVNAQDAICGTPTNNVYSSARVVGSSTASGTAIITVNVVFHIVNNVVTEGSTDDMISKLNTAFGPHKIQFTKLCVNHIGRVNTDPYDYPYAINIHILDQYITPYSGAIGSNTIYFAGSAGTTSTLPHEMGHCLYLFHTHNERGCLEFIDESNCDTCGDMICDTPADPDLSGNNKVDPNNCNYIGTATQNGVPYKPDTHNFMSYSPDACRNRFTIQQGIRMYNALTALDVLIPTTKPPQIQGSSLVCSSQVYSFNASQNSVVSWSSSNPNGLSINPATGLAIRQNNFNGEILVSATIVGGCGTTISKAVWVGSANNSAGLTVSGATTPAPGGLYNYRLLGLLPPEEGPFTYFWSIPSGNGWSFFSQNLNTTSVDVWVGTSEGSVQAYWSNGCGQTGTYLWVAPIHTGGGGGGGVGGGGPGPVPGPGPLPEIVISPNPSATTITVKVGENINSNTLDEHYQLFLSDKFGRKVFSIQSDEKNFDIPVSHLAEDIYYLNLIYSDVILQKQIVIKR